MAEIQKAILKAFKMVKTNGVVVVNAMHLTQILSMLNELNKNKIDYSIELVIEPSNRLWELRKIKSHNKFKESNNVNNSEEGLNWTCRLEDRFSEKYKRGGLYFNYWSGFLIKLKKN